ncbi:MAG: nucleoside-diphosphate sugar epimerase/dehydratase, partial [Faecalibacillus sp.]
MLNIIIFGTGKVFEKKIDTILTCNNLKIVGYIDNNPLKIGKRIQGKSVYNPEMIKDLSYDYVLITSENYLREMEEQLLAFGVPSGKILFWEKLCNLIKIGEMAHYGNFKEKKDKSMLIITAFLNYTGSSIAVFYLAQIANKLGYNVEIACPEVDLDFVEEVVREGITVSVYPQLPFINNIDISEYDFVVVNVFLMMISAIQLNGRVPVLW